MSRKDTIKYCNEQIFPQVKMQAWTGTKGELMEVVGVVENFRRNHGYPKPENMIARVDDGFLFINEIPVGRIAAKLNKPLECTEMAAYWEGKILANAGL